MEDDTVRGGTGWGAEFAKLCNKPLYVFDQDRDGWFRWTGSSWAAAGDADAPIITHPHFTGTGTRTLHDNSKQAIEDLFDRSFGKPYALPLKGEECFSEKARVHRIELRAASAGGEDVRFVQLLVRRLKHQPLVAAVD